jgi:acyl-CoA synthetase (AMP-forming)/AMP-acid ligase II
MLGRANAGAPCPIEVMRHVNHLMNMREVTIGYGMTETSPADCGCLMKNCPLTCGR